MHMYSLGLFSAVMIPIIPADILNPNWELDKPAAVDLCITSPLNYETLQVACVMPGSAAMQAEKRKHHSYWNDANIEKLGWVCTPLVVESFGRWGLEAQRSLSRLAGRLATRLRHHHNKSNLW